MTHLYIIRHGESLAAVQQTAFDPGLSPLGIKQAERLRDRLAGTGEIAADVLIASTMPRAKQTAEIIAPALGLPIIFDDEIQEQRPGEAVHMNREQLQERDQAFASLPVEQKPYFHFAPGAESWVEFMLRAATALTRITQEHKGKTIVLVCHGGIVDGSLIIFSGMSTLQFPPIYFHAHNTSITHWFFEENFPGMPPRWTLERYNDVMHLRDLDAAVRIPWQEISKKAEIGKDTAAVPTEAES